MSRDKTESRIFLIADTHFGDENIRLYEERPFPDTDTMDLEWAIMTLCITSAISAPAGRSDAGNFSPV